MTLVFPCLTSLSMLTSGFPCNWKRRCFLLYFRVILHWVYVPRLLCPLLCLRALQSLLFLCYCTWCCRDLWDAGVFKFWFPLDLRLGVVLLNHLVLLCLVS